MTISGTFVSLMAVAAGVACMMQVIITDPTPLPPPSSSSTPDTSEKTAMVSVRVFNDKGELIGPIQTQRVVKTDDQWRKQLTAEQYRITRNKGTEPSFCGNLLDNKKEGVYACVCCGLPLFSSASKFNSGTGWPSFFQPIAAENITEIEDRSHGMVRIEILCTRCDAHLGHVFDDGPRPTGLRYCLNSESLTFTPKAELAKLADPAAANAQGREQTSQSGDQKATGEREQSDAAANASKYAKAVFAGGCFWCVEAVFEELDGVIDVTSGYSGGSADTANYKAVCTGSTGHAEAVQITYDPAKITFEKLLEIHFAMHDPTTLNRQGNDIGTQYRSAIFYANEQEKKAAQQYIQKLNDAKAYAKPIVTTLEPLKAFYPAEAYHQNYACNNPNQGYVQAAALPKVAKVREKFRDLVKSRQTVPQDDDR